MSELDIPELIVNIQESKKNSTFRFMYCLQTQFVFIVSAVDKTFRLCYNSQRCAGVK